VAWQRVCVCGVAEGVCVWRGRGCVAYLVAECIATSTPGISSERWWKGVAKVASHMTHGFLLPVRSAHSVTNAPTAARSVRRHVGLAGDSVYTTLVFGRSAFANSFGSVASTSVHSIPQCCRNWLMNSFVPP
jgi:hypothetical protein